MDIDSRTFFEPGHDVNTASIKSLRWSWTLIVPAFVLVAAFIVGIPASRESILRAVGWTLVVKESVAPADIIVITPDSSAAVTLEAADLVQSGIATQVAVFVDLPSGVELEFIRRGLPYEDQAAVQMRQLAMLGVRNVLRIPRTEVGTEGVGQVIAAWCDEHKLRSVVFVVTTDHSRRLHRVLHRALKGHPASISIHPSRYSEFDPDRWWETRSGRRTAIIELQKLLLDIVRHPASS